MLSPHMELKSSPHEKLDIIPVKVSEETEMLDTEMFQLSSGNMVDCKSVLMHSSHTESTLVKNDFFRTSYPSLNSVMSQVDNVISKITPVAFEPPNYLDESLRKPPLEENETLKIQHAAPGPSKSVFASLRDSLIRFQISQAILPDAYNFISLMTTLCTLGFKAVHTIFMIVIALFPMIEILFHVSRFVIEHCLKIVGTRNRQEMMRQSFIFFVQVMIIFCLVVFIFGSVLLPLCNLGILILYKIFAFFAK